MELRRLPLPSDSVSKYLPGWRRLTVAVGIVRSYAVHLAHVSEVTRSKITFQRPAIPRQSEYRIAEGS
ncbi:hypothetical protein PVOR_26603 [Paenibacillus vortex V453]|uniref:Uncharacterized protein n=1 Tax=Paenibacillus vortex V453 TaxID=715225 RepID=A0A2R9SP96_9BACL|nr:hypothetical protein PVOR_26603 [Paenibacillus vortex V453]